MWASEHVSVHVSVFLSAIVSSYASPAAADCRRWYSKPLLVLEPGKQSWFKLSLLTITIIIIIIIFIIVIAFDTYWSIGRLHGFSWHAAPGSVSFVVHRGFSVRLLLLLITVRELYRLSRRTTPVTNQLSITFVFGLFSFLSVDSSSSRPSSLCTFPKHSSSVCHHRHRVRGTTAQSVCLYKLFTRILQKRVEKVLYENHQKRSLNRWSFSNN